MPRDERLHRLVAVSVLLAFGVSLFLESAGAGVAVAGLFGGGAGAGGDDECPDQTETTACTSGVTGAGTWSLRGGVERAYGEAVADAERRAEDACLKGCTFPTPVCPYMTTTLCAPGNINPSIAFTNACPSKKDAKDAWNDGDVDDSVPGVTIEKGFWSNTLTLACEVRCEMTTELTCVPRTPESQPSSPTTTGAQK